MSYWENRYGNQPGRILWHSQYSTLQGCQAAQAATGSYVNPDQCTYVDTTPAPPQQVPQQPDTQPPVIIAPVPAPAAGVVQVAGVSIDPKIIIALVIVVILGFLLSRR